MDGAVLRFHPRFRVRGGNQLCLDHSAVARRPDPAPRLSCPVPHTEVGYPFAPGCSVVLVADPEFTDATGTPLIAMAVREYTIGSAMRQRISPDHWRLGHPRRGTRRPVRVRFDRPMDHALAHRCLPIADTAGRRVPGESTVTAGERDWIFTPAAHWAEEQYCTRCRSAPEHGFAAETAHAVRAGRHGHPVHCWLA
jgi:hypothetical protein